MRTHTRTRHDQQVLTPDPTASTIAAARHAAWVSNGLLWVATARRLLRSGEFGDTQLGFVAFYLALEHSRRLLQGNGSDIARDAVAAQDAPYDGRALAKLAAKAGDIRNEILHLHEKDDPGHSIHVSWSGELRKLRIRSTVGQGAVRKTEELSAETAIAILDKLQPWLDGHWKRYVEAERPKSAADLLARDYPDSEANEESDRVASLLQGALPERWVLERVVANPDGTFTACFERPSILIAGSEDELVGTVAAANSMLAADDRRPVIDAPEAAVREPEAGS